VGILIGAVVLVGAICVLNLILTFGVIRRLKEHVHLLAALRATTGLSTGKGFVEPGERPQPFSATTIDGQGIDETSLTEQVTIVAFFSPDCASCKDWIPRFVVAAQAVVAGSGRAIAVVAAPDLDAVEAREALLEHTDVVLEDFDGPIHHAFSVSGYPSLCKIGPGGTVISATNEDVVAVPIHG
jgi:hypothetical protein